MGLMLPRIKLFFHALNPLVYPIPFSSLYKSSCQALQEDNDQAFPVTR